MKLASCLAKGSVGGGGEVEGNARRRRRRRRRGRRRRGRRDTGPRGPGWLAFEAGQKNGSRTRRRDIRIYI